MGGWPAGFAAGLERGMRRALSDARVQLGALVRLLGGGAAAAAASAASAASAAGAPGSNDREIASPRDCEVASPRNSGKRAGPPDQDERALGNKRARRAEASDEDREEGGGEDAQRAGPGRAAPPAQSGKRGKGKKKVALSSLERPGDGERRWPDRLIVLDFNGLLVSRSKRRIEGRSDTFKDTTGQFVYDRPYCRQLLRWLRQRGFAVAFWTSATQPVAEQLAKHLCDDKLFTARDITFVWSQEHCVRVRNNASTAPAFAKLLRRVWVDPELEKRFSPSNTVIVDDSAHKVQSAPDNAILTSSYDLALGLGSTGPDAELGQGGALWAYLDALSRHDGDVRDFIRAQRYVAPRAVVGVRDDLANGPAPRDP